VLYPEVIDVGFHNVNEVVNKPVLIEVSEEKSLFFLFCSYDLQSLANKDIAYKLHVLDIILKVRR
jgi:hypothetical protein